MNHVTRHGYSLRGHASTRSDVMSMAQEANFDMASHPGYVLVELVNCQWEVYELHAITSDADDINELPTGLPFSTRAGALGDLIASAVRPVRKLEVHASNTYA